MTKEHDSAWAGSGANQQSCTTTMTANKGDDARRQLEVTYDDEDDGRAWGRRRPASATTQGNVGQREVTYNEDDGRAWETAMTIERNNASQRREATVDDDNNSRAWRQQRQASATTTTTSSAQGTLLE